MPDDPRIKALEAERERLYQQTVDHGFEREALIAGRDQANKERDEAREALRLATWDLANYTFRGKPVSLGEEADALLAEYQQRALAGVPGGGQEPCPTCDGAQPSCPDC